ncbi:MAG: hypothetical protein Q9M94_07550, partial [Candidatus Gracilibacteria bacterium]|nr:hypothetical protein [Candidatus Gracilibacteria bacterium]
MEMKKLYNHFEEKGLYIQLISILKKTRSTFYDKCYKDGIDNYNEAGIKINLVSMAKKVKAFSREMTDEMFEEIEKYVFNENGKINYNNLKDFFDEIDVEKILTKEIEKVEKGIDFDKMNGYTTSDKIQKVFTENEKIDLKISIIKENEEALLLQSKEYIELKS